MNYKSSLLGIIVIAAAMDGCAMKRDHRENDDEGAPSETGPVKPTSPDSSHRSESTASETSTLGLQTDAETSIFPVREGRVWTYSETKVDGSSGSCSGSGSRNITTGIVGKGADETSVRLVSTPDCFPNYTWTYKVTKDFVYVGNGSWYNKLKLPPKEGDSWGAGGSSGAKYMWTQFESAITINGKVYNNCWKLTVGSNWEKYCEGVGMVQSHVSGWGQNVFLQLTSYSDPSASF